MPIRHVVLSSCTDISFQSVMNCEVCIRKELYAECHVVGGTAVFHGHASVYGGPVVVCLEVCDHEVLLVISPVMQATGWRIVHTWVQLHLMLTFAGGPLPTHCSTKFTTAVLWRTLRCQTPRAWQTISSSGSTLSQSNLLVSLLVTRQGHQSLCLREFAFIKFSRWLRH